jgi:prophage regulatory protein
MRRRPAVAVRGDSILRLPDVLARVGLSRPTLYRLIALGTFPRALPLGPQAVGWRASDVDQWIADRINPTDAARRTG